MNTLCYRLIFNAARQMMMVVADIARGHHASPVCRVPHRVRNTQTCAEHWAVKPVTMALWLALGSVTFAASASTIIADGSAPGNQQPTVMNTQNGLPQINIQAPNANGVSHNKYSQFDVDSQGAILNNSNQNVSTQLGGMVQANPWQAKGEAGIILNEVNSHNPSQLNGFIEVAGKKADVIIANPAGITCDGCGFINADNTLLSAGKTLIENGEIKGYLVDQGHINITGKGYNGTDTNYTALIGRSVTLNANLHAKQLAITTGKNQVAADGQTVLKTEKGDSDNTPAFALDVAALGGMYANSITMRGTEQGLGVRNAGHIGATAGEIALSADGKITNTGIVSSQGALTLRSQQAIANSGTLISQQDVTLSATDNISNLNKGQIVAGRDNRLQAATLTNNKQALLAAGVNEKGQWADAGSLTLNGTGALTLQGSLAAKDTLSATGSELDLSGSRVEAKDMALRATQTGINTRDARLQASQSAALTAQTGIDNQRGTITATTLSLTAPTEINNQQGTLIQTGAAAHTLTTKTLNNQHGEINLGGSAMLITDTLNNQSGTLLSREGALTLTTHHLHNQQGIVAAAGKDNTTIAADILNGEQGEILTRGALSLTGKTLDLKGALTQGDTIAIKADSLSHQQGKMLQTGQGQLQLTLGSALDNRAGSIASHGNIGITAHTLDNVSGKIVAGQEGALSLEIADNVDNQEGQLLSGQHLTLNALGVANQSGVISAAQGDASFQLKGTLDNQYGLIEAGNQLTLLGWEIDNQQGRIQANQLSINSQQQAFNNTQGYVLAAKDLTLNSGRLDNIDGLIQAGNDLSLDTHGALLTNHSLNAQRGIHAGHDTTLRTGDLLNTQGAISGQNTLSIHSQNLDNQDGVLVSQGDVALIAQNIDNRQGVVLAADNLMMSAQRLLNLLGQVLSVGNSALKTAYLDNTQGFIKANQTLTIDADQVLNHNTRETGQGIEAQTLSINADTLDNRAGALRAQDKLTLAIENQLANQQGLLFSAGNLLLQGTTDNTALAIDNQQGQILAQRNAALRAAALSGEGEILAQGNLALTLDNDYTHRGYLQAGNNLTLSLLQSLRNQGTIKAGNTLDVNAAHIDNAQAGEFNAYSTLLTATDTLTNYGLIDGVITTLNAKSINNLGTGRLYGDAITLTATHLRNDKDGDRAAVIAGRQHVNLGVETLMNRDHALIYSGGDLIIGKDAAATQAAREISNHSAEIAADGTILLHTDMLDNRDIHLTLSDTPIETGRESFDYFQWCEGDGDGGCYGGDGKRYILEARNGNNERHIIDENGKRTGEGHINYESSNRWRFYVDGVGWTKHFYQYRYDKVTYETQILNQDSANITSGGNLILKGGQFTNQDSKLVAGADLLIQGGELNQRETQGIRQIIEQDRPGEEGAGLISYYKGGKKWSTRTRYASYQGENSEQALSLGLMQVKTQAGVTTAKPIDAQTDTTLTLDSQALQEGSLSGNTDSTWQTPENALTLAPGQLIEVIQSATDGNGETIDTAIRVVGPDVSLPDNSLYQVHPGSNSQYLIETDPRFTDSKKWLSSLDFFGPDDTHKRLGDGYYEQKLVRDQLIQMTGQRYLAGYQNDEDQYRALLTNGQAFGEQYQLTPGVALSAEQMAALTMDIVWLVSQTVTLSDGSTETVLVPQVYVRVRPGDLNGQGALLAGNRVQAEIGGNIINQGSMAGREFIQLSGTNLEQKGVIQGNHVILNAQEDILNIGGTVRGGDSVTLQAGRDILSLTEQHTQGKEAWLDRPASIYVQNDKGELALQAQRDITLTAAYVGNQGQESQTSLNAGRDITLNTQQTGHATDYTRDSERYDRRAETQEVGSVISTQGDLTLNAGRDIQARAAEVDAQGALSANAGQNITIEAGESTLDHDARSKWTDSGFLSKTTHTLHGETHERTAQSSTLSGDTVALNAGNTLTVSGSNVLGENGVALTAGENVTITTADEARYDNVEKTKKKSGLMSTGGIGFTVGSVSQKQTQETDSNIKKGSVIGSSAGNVTISAGNTATVHGSDVIAAKDLSISGSDIAITAAENSRTDITTVETKQSGLSVSLGGAAGSALDGMVQTAKSAREEGDSQLAALKGIKAGLQGVQATQANRLASAQTGEDATSNGAFGVNLSYGSSSSKSVTTTEQKTASGSNLSAGDNLTLNANGHRPDSGNITVQGSELAAGKDTTLTAAQNIDLLSAMNTQTVDGKNESKGGSIGVGITAGSNGVGWNINASVQKGSGFEKGNSQYATDTTVNTGATLTLNSGQNTTLTGAQAKGDTVIANVGGNLTLSSQQAIDTYDAKQTHVSAGGSVGFGNGSLSLSGSRNKLESDYLSVQEQTGLFAGNGGFDITVGKHTQLDGAVIASGAEANSNRLNTGTLGFSDIHNHAEFRAEQQSVGFNTGGDIAGNFLTNASSALINGSGNSGKSDNTTHAAVSQGEITVRDTANQQQNVDDLSRDTDHAHQKLDTIFDKEKEQKRFAQAQLIAELAQQVTDIAFTEAKIAATQHANDTFNPTEEQRAEAEKTLGASGKNSDSAAVDAYLKAQAVQDYLNSSGWGTGGDNRRLVQAGTALIQGLVSGNITAAVANASAPYLANEIGKQIDSKEGKLAAHAIANVALALVKGENAAVQASGALTAEAIGMLSEKLYGKSADKLTEEEKSTTSAFASLAAGIAGALVGDSTQSATSAAQAGKVTVENNFLSPDSMPKGLQDYGQSVSSLHTNTNLTDENGTMLNPITDEQRQHATDKLLTGTMPEGQDISKAIVDGYTDGVLLGGAWYLGPAATVGKVVVGATLGGSANSAYQWYDLSLSGNENKSYDYWSTTGAVITGALAPGRDIGTNVGIAVGGSIFSDGANIGSMGGAAIGAGLGGAFGKYAPELLDPILGNASGLTSDIVGSAGGEYIGNKLKDKINEKK